MQKRLLTVIVCTILPAGARAAMQSEGILKLRAEARLVEVVVNVRDSNGRPVKDLQQSDFSIIDNGKRRPFTIFSVNDFDRLGTLLPAEITKPDPPRPALPPHTFTNTNLSRPPLNGHSTIILLDGINGYFESFNWGRKGVEGLMGKVPADEKIALYVIAKDLGLVRIQDYTSDREKLTRAISTYIQRLPIPAPPAIDSSPDSHGLVESSGPSRQPPPPNAAKPSLREVRYDLQRGSESVRLSMQALAEKLRTLPGRKSMFWVTQGFPPSQLRDMNQPAWDKTVSALNDANIAVNTVDMDGLGAPPRLWGAGGILSMQQLAERTGGEAFFHRNDLDVAMAQGIADSRASYTLAFYLTDVDGKYHDLKVRVDRPGVELNYRRGYWARSEGMAVLEGKKSDLESVLLNPVDSTALSITAQVEIVPGTPRGTVKLRLQLDSESLSVKDVPGGWSGKIDQMFLEQNAAGREVGRISVSKTLQIDAARKQAFDSRGLIMSQDIPLAADATKLVIVMRDTASGRTGSLTVPLSVGPDGAPLQK